MRSIPPSPHCRYLLEFTLQILSSVQPQLADADVALGAAFFISQLAQFSPAPSLRVRPPPLLPLFNRSKKKYEDAVVSTFNSLLAHSAAVVRVDALRAYEAFARGTPHTTVLDAAVPARQKGAIVGYLSRTLVEVEGEAVRSLPPHSP